MPQLKIKHGSWTYGKTRYGIGIHTFTDATPVDIAAEAFATENPDSAEYTGTTFTGAAATVYEAQIYRTRSLQPEIGSLLSKQQYNQSLYEAARQAKGRGPDQEFEPLVETAGDFDAIAYRDPAVAGDSWRQGDLPDDPGDRQQLAAPLESKEVEEGDFEDAVYKATLGELAHQPTGTNPERLTKKTTKDSEKAAKLREKAASKAEQETVKEEKGKK